MLWISTASQKIDDRIYMVSLWVKKYHEDAINRVVFTVDLRSGRHSPDEDQVRAELLCGHYFLLRKENKVVSIPDGRKLNWQAFTPALQSLLLNQDVPESLRQIADYFHMRWHGLTMVPMAASIQKAAMDDSISWVKVDIKYYWRNESLESQYGPVQITQKALVRFGNLAINDANASAIRILGRRLTSEHLQVYPMSAEELLHKQQMLQTEDVMMVFHAHYPSQKMLLARFKGQDWMMVDAFLFHHTKPKNRSKPKSGKKPEAAKTGSHKQEVRNEGESNGTGNYGVHRVVTVSGSLLDQQLDD